MATRPASPDNHGDLSGTLIAGRYRVRRTLGRGRIGTVSLCRAVWNDALVAVKVLHPELAAMQGTASAFLRAAGALAQLDHPNVVAIFESGADDTSQLPYFAMEYVDGRDLARVIAEDWPLSDARVVDIMSQVLRALSRAHALGVLHGDLKLSNILLRQRRAGDSAAEHVVVSDFDFAPLMAAGRQGSVAPENMPTEAFDIHAAGVVLFQLLTREPPFDATDPFEVRMQHRGTAEPAWISEIHPALQAVCLKALSKSPDARFQSANEMRTALEAALERASVPRGVPAVRSLAPGAGVSSAAAQPVRLAAHSQVAPHTAQPKPAQALVYGATARLPRRASSLAPAERVVAKTPERDVIPKRHAGRWLLVGVALLIAVWSGLSHIPRSEPWAFVRSALSTRASSQPSEVAPDGVPLAAHRDDAPAPAAALCKADSQAPEAPSAQATPSLQPSAAVAAEPPPPAEAAPAAVAAEPPPSAAVAPEQPPAAVAPAEAPSAAVAPAEAPSAAVAPTEAPSAAVAPTEAPSAAVAPEQPSAAVAPTEAPSAAVAPAEAPSAAVAPTEAPSAAVAPTEAPSAAVAPTEAPSAAVAPAEAPSAAVAPEPPPPAAAAPEPPSPASAPDSPRVAAPATTPPPTAAATQPVQARIAFGATFTPRGLSRLNLRDVIDQSGLTECYEEVLRASGASNTAFEARLDIETIKGRRITYASLRGTQLPNGLKACVERVALGSRLPSPVASPLALSATLTFQAP